MSGVAVHRKLSFGPFELSIGEGAPARRSGASPPGSGAEYFDYLANRQGEVIAKQELIDRVWSDETVKEGSLRVQVANPQGAW
jgi:hypothetical protein